MKSVGSAERCLRQAQEEMLGPTVHVTGQLHALISTTVEAPDDGALDAARHVGRGRAFTQATRQR